MARRKIFAANWKMHKTLDEVEAFVQEFANFDVAGEGYDIVVFCPATGLGTLKNLASHFPGTYGAQNMYFEASGAFTGEISAAMLNDFNCRYVIVGHSERRTLYGEDDLVVAKKFAAARAAGLVPVLCVGETLAEREQGITEQVVARQLDAVVDLEGVAALNDAVVAYEPVWAIGTGKTASPEQAQEVHAFIRSRVAGKSGEVAEGLRILYGGSMKPDNAKELLGKPDIDGGLIGGASLKAEDFLGICTAAN